MLYSEQPCRLEELRRGFASDNLFELVPDLGKQYGAPTLCIDCSISNKPRLVAIVSFAGEDYWWATYRRDVDDDRAELWFAAVVYGQVYVDIRIPSVSKQKLRDVVQLLEQVKRYDTSRRITVKLTDDDSASAAYIYPRFANRGIGIMGGRYAVGGRDRALSL